MENPQRAESAASRGGYSRTNELDAADSTPSHATLTTPRTCTRFIRCSAPICPVDNGWRRRKHLRGESVCLYLREAVKKDGEAVLGGCIPAKLSELVLANLSEILCRYADIKRRLERASTTPSKIIRPKVAQ